jgi:hypothetical protein
MVECNPFLLRARRTPAVGKSVSSDCKRRSDVATAEPP